MKKLIFISYSLSILLLFLIFSANVRSSSGSLDKRDPFQKENTLKKKTEKRRRPIQRLRQAFSRTTWARTYGDLYYDYAKSIKPTSDGGYIVTGYSTLTFSPHSYDASIIKLSSDGEIQWQFGYDGADSASSVRQTIDGGYIVAGTTTTNDITKNDFWVLKLDSAGNIEWQRAYGGGYGDWASSIWQTADGGYIVAGTTVSFSDGDDDIWILKLSSSGDIEWQRTYGGYDHDFAESIQQTSDGGYILAGGTRSFGAGIYDFLVLKLSAAGDIEWQKTYGETGSESAYSIQQTGDGGYILAGEDGRDIVIVKLSSTGAIEWQRAYSFWVGSNDHACSIKQTDDGGYIVAGYTYSFGDRGCDIWLIKISSTGDIEWQRTYGGEENEIVTEIDQNTDGGYIVAGYTWSFGAGNSDCLILKVSSSGEIEKFPELTRVTSALAEEASFVAQDIDIIPQETNIIAISPSVTSYIAFKKNRLVFSPPINFSARRVLNRSLSQAEYIDLLTWAANPNNSDLNIVKYRIYKTDIYSWPKSLVAELDANILKYLVRNVPKSINRTYAVCGVTDKDEEGMQVSIEVGQ